MTLQDIKLVLLIFLAILVGMSALGIALSY